MRGRYQRPAVLTCATALMAATVGTGVYVATQSPGAQAGEGTATSFYVNVGGGALVRSDGTPYQADAFVTGGEVVTGAVGGADGDLYGTQRVGLTGIKVPGLPSGSYRVVLDFAELEATGRGQRLFSVTSEGVLEYDEIDVWARAQGANKPLVRDFTSKVTDGTLDVAFASVKGAPTLAGFAVYPKGGTAPSSAPTTPAPTTPAPTPVTTAPDGDRSASPQPTPTKTPKPTPTPTPTWTPTPLPTLPAEPDITPVPGGRQVKVSTSEQLTAALAGALPGDVIDLAPGTYAGKTNVGKYWGSFAVTKPGTAAKPITLRGPRTAIIDGNGPGGRYGLYLVGANHWRISGITVANASKGIVADGSSNMVIKGVEVHNIGNEGIHLRAFSSDNVISDSIIHDTGIKNETYGEGVYLGSANSNWGTYSGGAPDASDRNQVLRNTIYRTGAESIDIKEGSTGGLVQGNSFDGAGMSGSWADSWIDLKGNAYTIVGNTGVNALEDGFQIHTALPGWGNDNVLRANKATVNGPGYGFWMQKEGLRNLWGCDNVVVNAAKGHANIACRP